MHPVADITALASMSEIHLVSLNVKGLGTPEKHSALLRELWKQRAQIALIQETHFVEAKLPRLSNRRYPISLHAPSSDSRARAVSILTGGNLQWQTEAEMRDPDGRFLLLPTVR